MIPRRLVLTGALVGAALVLEAAALAASLGPYPRYWLLLAAASHVLSARLTLAAARSRKELSRTEADVVLVAAVFIPLWGPVLGWALPRPGKTRKRRRYRGRAPTSPPKNKEGKTDQDSKEAGKKRTDSFGRYEEHVRPHRPDWRRSVFSGNFERDLARELDTETYAEVLRRGTTDQKRNALCRLADLGEPKHLELVRRCLLDPSHEVRLYAYAELERVGDRFEDEIDLRTDELEDDPGNREAALALARAHFDYGSAGVLDPEMGAYHYRLALKHAESPVTAGGEGPDALLIQALALCGLRELDESEQRLAQIAADQQNLPEVCIARAQIAFARREFPAARQEAERLRAADEKLPGWLRALVLAGGESSGASAVPPGSGPGDSPDAGGAEVVEIVPWRKQPVPERVIDVVESETGLGPVQCVPAESVDAAAAEVEIVEEPGRSAESINCSEEAANRRVRRVAQLLCRLLDPEQEGDLPAERDPEDADTALAQRMWRDLHSQVRIDLTGDDEDTRIARRLCQWLAQSASRFEDDQSHRALPEECGAEDEDTRIARRLCQLLAEQSTRHQRRRPPRRERPGEPPPPDEEPRP